MEHVIREVSFPFNAVEGDGGIGDRVYDAEDFARYWAQVLTNGVFLEQPESLKVNSLADNMVVTVHTGTAMLNGYGYGLLDDMPVTIADAHAVYMRKDILIVRLDLTERWVKVLYCEGTASASPMLPELIRTADIYDIQLAVITVRSGITKIEQSDILDTRLDETVCGGVWVKPLHVGTTDLFNQYQDYLNAQITAWDATKAQQAADWQAQMDAQQADMDEIQAWYTTIKADINTRQAIDFDDICALPGTAKKTEFPANGSIMSTATVAATGKKLATYGTVFPADGSIVGTLTVYAEDGVTVLKTQSKTTTFLTDGSIEEVISNGN